MLPSPWVTLVLALGTFRIVRLIGWDDLPVVVRARGWLTGENVWQRARSDEPTYFYARPTLAHFLGCAWCQGFWVCCAVYTFWVLAPTAALYVLAPFALNTVVALMAKHLDA